MIVTFFIIGQIIFRIIRIFQQKTEKILAMFRIAVYDLYAIYE